MPSHTTHTKQSLSDPVNNRTAALAIQPSTANELLLLSALRESEAHVQRMEVHAFELQASYILNEAYVQRLKQQLATKEEKKLKKAGKLVGDGIPCLLTGDEFYTLAKRKEKEQHDEERLKEDRMGAKQRYQQAVAAWKVADERRKEEAAVARMKNKKASDAFSKKKAAAAKRGTGLKPTNKPTLIPIPKAIPKPKLKDFLGGSLHQDAPSDDEDGGEDFGAIESSSEDDRRQE